MEISRTRRANFAGDMSSGPVPGFQPAERLRFSDEQTLTRLPAGLRFRLFFGALIKNSRSSRVRISLWISQYFQYKSNRYDLEKLVVKTLFPLSFQRG